MSARLLEAADAAQASIRGGAEPICQHSPKSGAMLSAGGVRGFSSGMARGKTPDTSVHSMCDGIPPAFVGMVLAVECALLCCACFHCLPALPCHRLNAHHPHEILCDSSEVTLHHHV